MKAESCRCIALVLLLLFGIAGVISTYTRLSETADELFHVSCGMEWWQKGSYTINPGDPPLPRIMDAALLHMVNTLTAGKAWTNLPPRDAYIDKMILTRLGTLPAYIISCLMVFIWSRRLLGFDAALWSLALYVSLSTVTAHGALATTDMTYTTALLWALMEGIGWTKTPGTRQSILLGVSLGLMIGSKFSGFLHWPAAMALIIFAQASINNIRQQPLSPIRIAHLRTGIIYVIPALIGSLGLIYRFSFTPLLNGIESLLQMNRYGFSVWLYGPLYNHGVWYFFLVVFFFKTPLPFLISSILGNGRIAKEIRNNGNVEKLFPLLAATGIILISMISNINVGVRHVLPLYPLLSIPAGYGLHWLWQGTAWKRGLAAGLLIWQAIGFIHAYPEQLAYFNALAGDHPEHITLDSDYDWGQDYIILDEALQARKINTVYLCLRPLNVSKWNASALLHAKFLSCPSYCPASGWIAVSRAYKLLRPDNFAWLNEYETVQIGTTIDLYYIPPAKP